MSASAASVAQARRPAPAAVGGAHRAISMRLRARITSDGEDQR